MRGNRNRLNRLKDEVESLTAKMREAAEEEEAAAKRANDMYEKILVHNAEIERLRTEARQIRAGEAQPIHTAADAAKVIEELRGNYEARFNDVKLPSEILAQKDNASKLLSQLATALTALSQLDVGLQVAAKAEEEKSKVAAAAAEAAAAAAAAAAATASTAAVPGLQLAPAATYQPRL